ncbi:MAG: hypothetical protein LE168_00950 [Endomicrobium sp.]|nr:hypothetical protein [Endomicrobium sp.]
MSREFRNPLSAILGYCDLLICVAEKDSSQGKSLKGLNVILEKRLECVSR